MESSSVKGSRSKEEREDEEIPTRLFVNFPALFGQAAFQFEPPRPFSVVPKVWCDSLASKGKVMRESVEHMRQIAPGRMGLEQIYGRICIEIIPRIRQGLSTSSSSEVYAVAVNNVLELIVHTQFLFQELGISEFPINLINMRGNRPIDLDLIKCCQPHCLVCDRTSRPDGKGLLKCSRCLGAQYCGSEHQKENWPRHKGECKSMRSNYDASIRALSESLTTHRPGGTIVSKSQSGPPIGTPRIFSSSSSKASRGGMKKRRKRTRARSYRRKSRRY
jgi:hypothetical protein